MIAILFARNKKHVFIDSIIQSNVLIKRQIKHFETLFGVTVYFL
ncbi:hypothetical protein ABFG93_07530 [Pseudalkalibacillus hwajinpoensis]